MVYLSQSFLFGALFSVANGAASSGLVFVHGEETKDFVHSTFQFFPQRGSQLSFSEGPWNTVWRLEMRLMCQRELCLDSCVELRDSGRGLGCCESSHTVVLV